MKKKIVSVLLVAAMAATTMFGCGSSSSDSSSSSSSSSDSSSTTSSDSSSSDDSTANFSDDGTVLNIYCWNEEFQTRITAHYADYEEIDSVTGKIGDVTVNWIITPSDDNAYQDALDAALLAQDSADADDKIDIFLIEADYALKYVDTDYTLSIYDLGITDADIADQYKYTQDIVTDASGDIKGLSWQACPGIMFYNREIAKEVLGTDDPDEVQALVSDWDSWLEVAELMSEAGYYMVSTPYDTYRVYSNNVSSTWVVDGGLNIDDNIMNWIEDSMNLVENGYTLSVGDLWESEWYAGMMEDSGVFCYFGPAWLINFCMMADTEGSVAYNGGWGGCVGPQSFYWGGTWICAATGTDNASLVKDILLTMTTDTDVLSEIVEQDDDFANNKTLMESYIDSDYTSTIMGGQNPMAMYCEGADNISLDYLSAYDQGCNEDLQSAIKNYFTGNATLEEALSLFYTAISEKYPALTLPE